MKKHRKSPILIGSITTIITIIILVALAIRKENRFSKDNNTTIEINYRVAETSTQSCVLDSECETPEKYLIQSNCPYTSKCIDKTCAVICPDIDTKRRDIQKAINNCEVTSVFQNHQNEVEATLKNGDKIKAIEPNIDVIFDVVTRARNKCGEIQMATE